MLRYALLTALAFFLVPANTRQIPETHAVTLSDAPINLPADLKGHPTVLILGFSQRSREAVTQWALRLAADYRDSPTVLYFEMPVLTEVPRLLRGVVIRKIKQDVPPRAQPRFVPITDHAEEWRSLTGYDKDAGEDAAYLVLLNASGAVKSHQAEGPPTDASYASLRRQIEAVN